MAKGWRGSTVVKVPHVWVEFGSFIWLEVKKIWWGDRIPMAWARWHKSLEPPRDG